MYQGYKINSFTFYTGAQDYKSTNQNSGVRIDATDSSGQTNSYFGYIEEIWELDYGPLKIPLCSRENAADKRLSELCSLSWKRRLQTSQAIDWGLRTPRTQQHLQKTSPQLSPSEQQ